MAEPQKTRWWKRISALAELHGDHTQQEIAESLGVSPGAVTGWRYGRPPRAETVVRAAEVYGVDPGELLILTFIDPKKGKPRRSADDSEVTVTRRLGAHRERLREVNNADNRDKQSG
ncbi:hypothetical protein ABW16_01955 [Mycolicibacter heraklionensis]|uniref:HTH cro/C1-type domain-containing protein n=1 Tax=Mycolicibacter heraklionensis TaxID=512402 RepID=A0ABR5FKR1_9MYCO|nr:helix-turn-helix transcriptional regulator [Mycolicibacter heraklionensis]KLO31614.1 hypothetical protein ABW16_01955 [Mycolicibacter heraklionensis]